MDERTIKILQKIQSGKESFRPRSQSEADMVDFQAVAKALVYLDGQGYLDGFRPHKESSTGNSWYDFVMVTNGLTYTGEEVVKQLATAADTVSTGVARQFQPRLTPQAGVMPRITLDTNCVINAFDSESPSATSVSEIMTLLRCAMAGQITVAITTRVEKDLLKDRDDGRRARSLRTLDAFPVIGTVGRMDVSRWDGGDVFSSEQVARLCEEVQQTIFPGLQPTDRRYENKRNDVDHLVGHLLNRRDLFVTDDGDILRRADQLESSPGIVVLSPGQCLRYVDNIDITARPIPSASRSLHPAYHSLALNGQVTFDYSNNNHRYALGNGRFLFETQWSKASRESIYACSDCESIRAIAVTKDATTIAHVRDARTYDYSSRARTARIGQVVLWVNVSGLYAATKIVSIKDDSRGDAHDELTIEYVILSDGSHDFGR